MPASAQVARKKAAARRPLAEEEELAWDRYLVKDAPEPTFRFAVAHQHRGTGCFGYLYISRTEVRYVVKKPPGDSDHGFRLSRASLSEARQWRLMGSSLPEVEFKFENGKTYHFYRVRETLLEGEGTKFRMQDVRTWEPLAQAALHFDEVLALAQQRTTPSSGGPKVRVMEPVVADPSVPTEVSEGVLNVRGAALDARGVLSVSVNDRQADLRSTGDVKVVEFSVHALPLQEGLNRLTIVATNVDHQSAQLAVPVWLRGKGTPMPAQHVKRAQPGTQPSSPAAAAQPPPPAVGPGERVTLEVFSDPSGAEILLDGDFMGNTPSILKPLPGKHVVDLQLPGFETWKQDLNIAPGAGLTTLRATLEKAR
jgi:hypothetical protein